MKSDTLVQCWYHTLVELSRLRHGYHTVDILTPSCLQFVTTTVQFNSFFTGWGGVGWTEGGKLMTGLR